MTLLTATGGGDAPFNGETKAAWNLAKCGALEVEHWWKGSTEGQAKTKIEILVAEGTETEAAQPTAMTSECHEHDAMSVCVCSK